MTIARILLTASLFALRFAAGSLGQTVVFTEEFTSGPANWAEGPAPFGWLDHVPSGGPDGGAYVTDTRSITGPGDYTLFRGHDAYDSSGDAFAGDWIDAGYSELSAYVRHSAPVPLTYFARLSTRTTSPFVSDNFPAALAIEFAPVPPGEWTRLSFDVSPGSPQLVSYEGSSYGQVFSDITNVQFGFSIPDGVDVVAADVVFDLDKVSLAVPEPASGAMLAMLLAAVAAGGVRGRCS